VKFSVCGSKTALSILQLVRNDLSSFKIGCGDGQTKIVNFLTNKIVTTLSGSSHVVQPVMCVRWKPNSVDKSTGMVMTDNYLLTVSSDGAIDQWSIPSGKLNSINLREKFIPSY
jgi:WD40 repeat protein